jgi:hypothetical protein
MTLYDNEGFLDATTSSPLPELDVELNLGPRIRKPTARLLASRNDSLPEGPGYIVEPAPPSPGPSRPRVRLYASERLRTVKNSFGLWREYPARPSRIPDIDKSAADFVLNSSKPLRKKKHRKILDVIWPYPNLSSFLFGLHFRKGSVHKTAADRKEMQNLFEDDRFNSKDIRGVDFEKIDRILSEDKQSPFGGTGWTKRTVTIKVPTGVKETKESRKEKAREYAYAKKYDTLDPEVDDSLRSKDYQVPNVYTRSLMHIMKSMVTEDAISKDFHWHGYKEFWDPPYEGKGTERVRSELYNSDAFLEAERRLLNSDPEPDCDLPRVIFGFMFASDATHVAQFGQASLWPGYMNCANGSKYQRCTPSAGTTRHFAYFPKVQLPYSEMCKLSHDIVPFQLPDGFGDFLGEHNIRSTPQLKAHCKRELFHAVWRILLDDEEFRHAYKHGIVLECTDGIKRRFYPRIFTYSADYPEK